MARRRTPARPGPDARVRRRAPDRPTRLRRRGWKDALRRTVKEMLDDELTDRAASLTYYGVLAIFPTLLLLVSVIGLVGRTATEQMLDNLRTWTPGPARDILLGGLTDLQGSRAAGGALAVVGLAGALWSASGYIAAFIRASNAVYDIREGRPVWKLTPLRLGLTVLLMLLLAASAVIVVFTGPVARRAGEALGIGDAGVAVWSVAKWPVLLLLVTVMIGVLYWAAPNVRGRGFRWVSPGSFLAVGLWLALSGGFAAFVANFASYNRIYGTLGGVIVFLIWLWLSNLAILLGLEFDAELSRARAVQGGLPRDAEPYVEPRSTHSWADGADRRRHGPRGGKP
ncbi:YihY/virulence factor BrkB family protein [Kitasatospora sp. NPDC051914]|uniref:YihY/virulence factor BrkB family protein n=1 Tax=Kitasatospora sp. NPDC051914 TaxID=3154945 RepID=UPI00342D5420